MRLTAVAAGTWISISRRFPEANLFRSPTIPRVIGAPRSRRMETRLFFVLSATVGGYTSLISCLARFRAGKHAEFPIAVFFRAFLLTAHTSRTLSCPLHLMRL